MANIYDSLERVFHEPRRLSIASALSEQVDGLTFPQLKQKCGLTDGNLGSHLSVLEKAGAISITKSFADRKPKTTVTFSTNGRKSFLQYLGSLEAAVKHAQKRAARHAGSLVK